MEQYLIVDIGSSSLRVVVQDAGGQECSALVHKRSVGPCLDADLEWREIRRMIAAQASPDAPLRGLAVSALLGWVGVDAAGRAVTPCFTYMHREPAFFEPFAAQHPAAEVYRVCRRKAAPEQLAFKMARLMREEPEVYGRIRYFVSLKDYINLQLTGLAAVDHTTACYSLLYDVEKAQWSPECLGWLGLDGSRLPPLLRPWEPLGPVLPPLQRELGLPGGCTVAVGSVDGSTGVLGAGGLAAGTMVSIMGTTDTCFSVQSRLPEDGSCSLVVNPHVIPGLWLAGGPMGMYGGTLGWLLNTLLPGTASLQQLTALAAPLPPGSEGVVAYPQLAGERAPFWNAQLCGTFLGLTPAHGAQHLFRAVLEANCYGQRRMREILDLAGAPSRCMIAAGGGAGSDLWLQIKANVLQLPVARSRVREATTEGSRLLALLACGCAPADIPAAPAAQTFEVCPGEAARYAPLYRDYLRIHDQLAAIYPLHPAAAQRT